MILDLAENVTHHWHQKGTVTSLLPGVHAQVPGYGYLHCPVTRYANTHSGNAVPPPVPGYRCRVPGYPTRMRIRESIIIARVRVKSRPRSDQPLLLLLVSRSTSPMLISDSPPPPPFSPLWTWTEAITAYDPESK
eukprot:2324591-Rhodomonas_salina.3